MSPVLSALGVDARQWKALTLAGLRVDVRTRAWRRDGGVGRPGLRLALQLGTYLGLGGLVAGGTFLIDDLFSSAVIAVSAVFLAVGLPIVLDHHAFVTVPADYLVVGYRPVTPRTWISARLTLILIYALAITTAVALFPVVAFYVRHGMAVGTAAVVAFYAAGVTMTMAIVTTYVWVVARWNERRLVGALSYVQLVVTLLLLGCVVAAMNVLSVTFIHSLALAKSPAWLLYPGAWFASYLEIAGGWAGPYEWLAAALPPVALAALTLWLRSILGRLSGDRMAAVPAPVAGGRARLGLALFPAGEGRAVAMLLAAQLRADIRLRMGIFALLPLVLLYVFFGITDDPGTVGGRPQTDLGPIALSVMLFAVLLRMMVSGSDAFGAAWVFRVSPADPARIVRGVNRALFAWVLAPYLVAVGATLYWFTGTPHLAALAIVGVNGYLIIQAVSLARPDLPFSRPRADAFGSISFFVLMVLAAILSAVAAGLIRWSLEEPLRVAAILAALGTVAGALDRLVGGRARRARS